MMSPTNDAVVMKTLEMAKQIADECNQKHIVATFDLAIAMKAFKIKDDMSPKFNDIFVNLGGFHILLSYFKVCVFHDEFHFQIIAQTSITETYFHFFSWLRQLENSLKGPGLQK